MQPHLRERLQHLRGLVQQQDGAHEPVQRLEVRGGSGHAQHARPPQLGLPLPQLPPRPAVQRDGLLHARALHSRQRRVSRDLEQVPQRVLVVHGGRPPPPPPPPAAPAAGPPAGAAAGAGGGDPLVVLLEAQSKLERLCRAAHSGHAAQVRDLLAQGADARGVLREEDGRPKTTPLNQGYKHLEVVELLCAAGALPEVPGLGVSALDLVAMMSADPRCAEVMRAAQAEAAEQGNK